MKALALLFATLAAALTLPAAHAAPASTASITYSNLQFQVIDLAPNDNVAAGFSLTGTSSSTALKIWDSSYQLASSSEADFTAIGHPAETLSFQGKELLASATDTSAAISASVPARNVPEGYGSATNFSSWEFTLTPNTALIFTGIAQLAVNTDVTNQRGVSARAELLGIGSLSGDSALASFEYTHDTSWQQRGLFNHGFGLALSNISDQFALGSITLEATGYAFFYPSMVPEPAAYWMFCSGLAVAALAARRRHRGSPS